VYDWYKGFRSGQELLEDEPCSERPSTSVNAETVSKLKELVPANWQIAISEAANDVGISYGSVKAILTKLQMRLVCAKFVQQLLTDDQRECWKTFASGLFEKSTQDAGFLGNIVTEDESQVFTSDSETKQHSSK
jgi:hypothetical protein